MITFMARWHSKPTPRPSMTPSWNSPLSKANWKKRRFSASLRSTASMVANTGFTIEPGVYFPHFGVRLEINVFVDPARGPVVTSCVQDEIVRLV